MLTPGEVKKGMHIVVYECSSFRMVENNISGMPEKIQEWHFCPWFKGIPYKVLGVAGTILMVKSFPQPKGGIPSIVFLDTRCIRFVQVTKSYYETYIKENIDQQGNIIGGKDYTDQFQKQHHIG